jgi:gamma-glutamylcyclotransferase (GGCT)/AIG2-like uncharacterized protein YtfP
VHYFAYGSNLNWPQMRRRCPSSEFVCIARLSNYRLGITRHSRLRNCGTANICPAQGEEVWGAVYDVSVEDLVALDSFEDGYRREILTVHVLENGTAPLDVLIYVAELDPDVPLSNAEYKRLILEGAQYWKLPPPYITRLGEIIVAP